MARKTSTQQGASRRTTRTATSGSGARGASSSRSRKPAAASSGARKPSASRGSKRAPARARIRIPGPWVPVVVVVLLAVLGWSLYPALRLQYQASRRMAGLEQQYESLKKRNDSLRSQVADLKTPQGVEKAAREDLGYAKSGEHVYVVVPSGTATSAKSAAVSTSSVADTSVASFVRALLDSIFGVQQPTSTVEP